MVTGLAKHCRLGFSRLDVKEGAATPVDDDHDPLQASFASLGTTPRFNLSPHLLTCFHTAT